MQFCEITGNLLTVAFGNDGNVVFKSPEGKIYPAKPEQLVLISDDFSEARTVNTFNNTLAATAFEPINPRIKNPCPKCHRAVVSYQRIGENGTVIHMCVCGYLF